MIAKFKQFVGSLMKFLLVLQAAQYTTVHFKIPWQFVQNTPMAIYPLFGFKK